MKKSFQFWFNFAVLLFQLWINGMVGWSLLRTMIVVMIVVNLVAMLVLEWKRAPK